LEIVSVGIKFSPTEKCDFVFPCMSVVFRVKLILPTFCKAGLLAESEEDDEFFLHAWMTIRIAANIKADLRK
jgi:hypothetical protein